MITYVCKISDHGTTSFDGSPCSILSIHRSNKNQKPTVGAKLDRKLKTKKKKKRHKAQKFTTIQCKNLLDSFSCLKASKAETHGVKKP
jgi:hypothetical protein